MGYLTRPLSGKTPFDFSKKGYRKVRNDRPSRSTKDAEWVLPMGSGEQFSSDVARGGPMYTSGKIRHTKRRSGVAMKLSGALYDKR
jgi:hypothetical protein